MFPNLPRQLLLGYILVLSLIPTVSCSACPPPIFLPLSNCTIAGTAIDSWGLRLDLADPSQYLCVVPSTVVNSTLVISSTFCQTEPNVTTAQCESLCGNTFNTSIAGTSYTSSSPGAVLAPNPVWAELSPQALLAGTTVLQLPPENDVSKFPIGIITSGNHQNAGHFGLANDSDALHSLLSDGLIPDNGFGFNAGSQSVTNPRDGGLVLGGYDLASIDGAFSTFPVATTADAGQRECPFQITITMLVLRFPLAEGFTDVNLTSPGILIPACIEPYDNLFRFPQTILQAFQTVTGWSSNTTPDPNLYIAEPGLNYPQMTGFNGSLIFTLNDGYEVEIPNDELSNPLRGIDTNGARVLQPNITEVGIFYQEAPLNTAVLGKVFLSQVSYHMLLPPRYVQ
ncbi:hypothetical protein OIDMADRAFT_122224 [Oidiodendron maius Zn]|uniref:Peptidase A1 domain-containing protein n=1 Tax=Oidiodendron maius (strain Zn) TaxID=913774 RepID=A0A0C3HH15_OIDMZ|nr:hypothetical protein OIDMADRAFT_122224 [Oidiodendron maius Zn]